MRVIGSDGTQLGVMPSRQALNLAKDEGLDLVMVAPNADPPVCRIIDHGKFKYDQEKRERESKRKQQDVKGIKISPRIADHDLEHLLKKADEFLRDGDKVKVVCRFRAREITHPEIGQKRMEKMAQALTEIAIVERPPTMDGKMMVMVLAPRPQSGKKHAKAENQQDGSKAVQDHGDRQDHSPEVL